MITFGSPNFILPPGGVGINTASIATPLTLQFDSANIANDMLTVTAEIRGYVKDMFLATPVDVGPIIYKVDVLLKSPCQPHYSALVP